MPDPTEKKYSQLRRSTAGTRRVDQSNALASAIESNHAGNGRIENGAENDAATQGVVAQRPLVRVGWPLAVGR